MPETAKYRHPGIFATLFSLLACIEQDKAPP
jgi:hypothetical protein